MDARSATERLVRLTRYVINLQESAGVPAPREAPDARRLRHTESELSGREQLVLGNLLKGKYNRALAAAFTIDEAAFARYLEETLRAFAKEQRRRRTRHRAAFTVTAFGAAAGLFALTIPAAPAGRPIQFRPGPFGPFGVTERFGGSPHAAFFSRLQGTLPSGVATATSFWDPLVVLNRRMTTKTLASPYWPLGTRVRISYGRRTVVGVVRDFGPAPWAIAQHRIPAIIDTAEPMMRQLTGVRVNAVPVHFEVLNWGPGHYWLTAGPGYGLAMGSD
jgi:hypothetical protein